MWEIGAVRPEGVGIRRYGDRHWYHRDLVELEDWLPRSPAEVDPPAPDVTEWAEAPVNGHTRWADSAWRWASDAWWARHWPDHARRIVYVLSGAKQRVPLVRGGRLVVDLPNHDDELLPPTAEGWARLLALAASTEVPESTLRHAANTWWWRTYVFHPRRA